MDVGSQGIDSVDVVVGCVVLLMQTRRCRRACLLVVCSLVSVWIPVVVCELILWRLVVVFGLIPLLMCGSV